MGYSNGEVGEETHHHINSMNNQIKSLFILILTVAFIIEGSVKAFEFYKNHLHEHVIEGLKRLTAITLTIAFFLSDGIIHLWNNRQEYIKQLNTIRNNIGGYFILDTVALA